MTSLLWLLLIGLAAGWLAGQLLRGGSFGLVGNLVVGVIGSALGGLAFRLVGLQTVGVIGELISATFGAILLLYLLRYVRKG